MFSDNLKFSPELVNRLIVYLNNPNFVSTEMWQCFSIYFFRQCMCIIFIQQCLKFQNKDEIYKKKQNQSSFQSILINIIFFQCFNIHVNYDGHISEYLLIMNKYNVLQAEYIPLIHRMVFFSYKFESNQWCNGYSMLCLSVVDCRFESGLASLECGRL